MAPSLTEELDPVRIGRFDIVVCDGLLRRAHNAVDALEAVHRVTIGMLLSAEPIDLWSSLRSRGKPVVVMSNDAGGPLSTFNGAAHKEMLCTAGFSVERVGKPYRVPADHASEDTSWRARLDGLVTGVITGSAQPGQLHRALLARARTA